MFTFQLFVISSLILLAGFAAILYLLAASFRE